MQCPHLGKGFWPSIRGCFGFYRGKLAYDVGEHRVTAQPGGLLERLGNPRKSPVRSRESLAPEVGERGPEPP